MRYKQQKETLIGKLIAAIAWVMMIILLGISSLYAVVEDMSVEGLLAAGASIAAATLAFLGLQVLASVVDDGLTARKKAQKKEPASAEAPERTMNQAVSAPDHPASAKDSTEPKAKPVLFTAAGKPYHSAAQLEWKSTDHRYICLDVYGRPVACFFERFPCFDSYDYLYEDRYYRWYLIPCGENWTVVSTEDDSEEICVRENLNAAEALAACRGPEKAMHVLADIREMMRQQA